MNRLAASGRLPASKKSSTATSISPQVFAAIERFVTARIATQLDGKDYLVVSRLGPIARTAGLRGIDELSAALESGEHPELEELVLDAMTINETSFFRDVHPFESLAEHILPELVRQVDAEHPLTIWNGACSSGQESLSLAMTIHEHFPEIARPEFTRILSTDVAPSMVKRTREAVYSTFEVHRGLSTPLLEKYFRPDGRNWVARSSLTDLIDVQQLNLTSSWPLIPRCDVVLLRNVLIYFAVETKALILRKIRQQVLRPNGYLLLGASESTLRSDEGYVSDRVGKATVFVAKNSR